MLDFEAMTRMLLLGLSGAALFQACDYALKGILEARNQSDR